MSGVVWSFAAITPKGGEVIMMYPDGHQERRAPPPDIGRLWPGANHPDVRAGVPRALVSLGLLVIVGVIGRRALTWRRRRERREAVPVLVAQRRAIERP
jgi:hypothetical protein